MGRVDGKVAFITGAARGQGRAHAVRFAEEGAHIVAVDSCGGNDAYPWMTYPMATEADLAETARLVEPLGRASWPVRRTSVDLDIVGGAVQEGLDKFGHIDIVSANAGISPFGPETWLNDDRQWTDVYEVNLLGVRNTCKAVVPAMIAAGGGGSIVMTSSGAGLKRRLRVVGLLRDEVGRDRVRPEPGQGGRPARASVSTSSPRARSTPTWCRTTGSARLFRPDLENPTRRGRRAVVRADEHAAACHGSNRSTSRTPCCSSSSDEARYITGVVLSVDAGMAAN